MGRSGRTRIKLKPVLFIACEGVNTEYDYFSSWAKRDEVLEFYEAVNVYPSKSETNPHTTPYQLYEVASQVLAEGSANEAWIVFDKDNHPRIPEVFANSSAQGIHIAFSSRSFEEWVLMHFERNATTYNATQCKVNDKPIDCGAGTPCSPIDCLSGHIRRQNFISDYSKTKNFDLFGVINGKTEIAIVNSAWLRFSVNASKNIQQPPLHLLNPYTDVDQLILRLLSRNDKIEWGNAGTNISLGGWTISASRGHGQIILRISHSANNPQPLNALFYESSFYTTDENLINTNCMPQSQNYLVNANGSTNQLLYKGDVVEFILTDNNQPYFLFKDTKTHTRIYIQL